jgi:hypothetical protein
VHHGAGADTDIIVASVQAYLRALDRVCQARPVAALDARSVR